MSAPDSASPISDSFRTILIKLSICYYTIIDKWGIGYDVISTREYQYWPRRQVNIGILWSISHHVQCLSSQQLFYYKTNKTNKINLRKYTGPKFWPITPKLAIMFLSFNILEWILEHLKLRSHEQSFCATFRTPCSLRWQISVGL